jgi:hypothetical protein
MGYILSPTVMEAEKPGFVPWPGKSQCRDESMCAGNQRQTIFGRVSV